MPVAPLAHLGMAAVILAALTLSTPTHAQIPAAQAQAAPPPLAVTVTAKPISAFQPGDPARVRFGALQFRSGLSLTSKFPDFGGLSGLRLDAAGERFTAISDKANWFTGRIVYQGEVMTGLADVVAAPMLGEDGKPIAARKWFDTEALTFDGATAYVGIERAHQILSFDFGTDGVLARGRPLALPPALRRMPNNKGLEALVMVRKGLPLAGTLIAISERALDPQGNIRGWLISGALTRAQPSVLAPFAVRRTDDYDVSDAAMLPGGDLLLMERKFSWLKGAGVRIRRVAHAALAAGAVIDGPVLFEADLGYEIDNLEGLDVHVTAEGDTVLTMISDDNFSMLQRTLLLQFTLME